MKAHRSAIVWSAAALLAVCGVALSSCGKSSNPMNTVPPADLTITIVGSNGNMSFSPNPATVTVGQTVAWKNSGGMVHTATADAGGFDTGGIANGATSAPITMGISGSFPYHCTIHPTMVGTLNVNP